MFEFLQKRKISSDKILTIVNPIERIKSTEDIQKICEDSKCLTLIESAFFAKIKPIIQEICFKKIDGDIVNIGVFKGGASLYMKALFEQNNNYQKWWLFDSFCGFNETTLTKKRDKKALRVFKEKINLNNDVFPSKNTVYKLFKKNRLSKNLSIIEGYIENTLREQKIANLCFIHIDVDFYEPTYYALDYLYPYLNKGGWVIIDDYNVEEFHCKDAVDRYRNLHNIDSQMIKLGTYQIGWRKD